MSGEWGPLAALIGEWEGEGGVDVSFHHAEQQVADTVFLERVTMKPFGPVDNGRQSLYGLDYKTAMWRNDEADPFHTEVGYWLWDAADGEVLRCFAVPRGIAVVAGGTAAPDATEFTLKAAIGDPRYAIGESTYLSENASSVSYEVTVSINGDGTWSYDETTMLRMTEFPEIFPHTDHNTLRRVG